MAHSSTPTCMLLFLFLCVATGVLPQDLGVSPPRLNFDCSRSTPQLIGTGSGDSRIKTQASKLTTWPWMALVGKKGTEDSTWACAGMLINEQWVLTAAQCVINAANDVVRLGEYDFSDDTDGAPHQDYEMAEVHLHPDYIPGVAYHDLALVRLNSTVDFQRFISPVCLPWGDESKVDIAGNQGWVLSFENIFQGFPGNTIQNEVEMTIFSGVQCDSKYANIGAYTNTFPRGIGEETVCAVGLVDGQDACRGDSGGPLVTQDKNGRYIAGGIVVGGVGCGNKDFPGYYTNLRFPLHLIWIKSVAFNDL